MVQHEGLRQSRKTAAPALRQAIALDGWRRAAKPAVITVDYGRRKRIGADSGADRGAGSAPASSISTAGFGIASITSMPRVWQILARPAGSAASVTKVWIWLIWAMRTGALRLSFVESATSITLRALAMIACAACTSR